MHRLSIHRKVRTKYLDKRPGVSRLLPLSAHAEDVGTVSQVSIGDRTGARFVLCAATPWDGACCHQRALEFHPAWVTSSSCECECHRPAHTRGQHVQQKLSRCKVPQRINGFGTAEWHSISSSDLQHKNLETAVGVHEQCSRTSASGGHQGQLLPISFR